MPISDCYDVFEMSKNSWKTRRLNKKLIVEKDGKITLFGETEASKDTYYLKDI